MCYQNKKDVLDSLNAKYLQDALRYFVFLKSIEYGVSFSILGGARIQSGAFII